MGALARRIECASCGSRFVCERSPDCWCRSVRPSKERLNAPKAVSVGCACPSCLSSAPTVTPQGA